MALLERPLSGRLDLDVKRFYDSIGYKILRDKFKPPEIADYLQKEDDFLIRNIPINSTVLDVGCGEGRQLAMLSSLLKKGVGIDASLKMISAAKKRHAGCRNLDFRQMDARALEFKDNCFDYSFCMFNTLLNIPDYARALAEMARVARASGYAVVSVYSEDALEARKKFYRNIGLHISRNDGGWVYAKEGFISGQMTEWQIREMFASAGMDVKIEMLCPIAYVCRGQKA